VSENENAGEIPAGQDFASLFEASYASHKIKRLTNGQVVEGTIVSIGAEVVLVDVGAKSEATIALADLKNKDGVVEAKVGDRLQATVVSTTGGLHLSRRMQRGAASSQQLEDAARAGLPVEGKVEKIVKAGYEVTVAGQRAFCPQSQIDDVRESAPLVHVGRTYTFKIVEYKEGGQKFVVSRRRFLEEEQQARASEVRLKVVPDAILPGRVVSVRDFGAFIDLGGGVQGLLHASEMGWSRVDPAQVVKIGDEFNVKVLRIEADKIALGLKQLTADPWSTAATNYAVGQVFTGKVTRLSEFGAFVELEPGVEALAHASTFAPTGKIGGWSKSIAPGMTGAFEVLSVDPAARRIGVAIVPEGSTRAEGARPSRVSVTPGARITGKVERHDKMGIFVFLAPGITGLLPASETGTAHGVDLVKTFPVGSDVDVIVLEADPARRRIRLSVKAIAAAAEAAEVSDYTSRAGKGQAQSFGSLADKLRGALESRKK
jgi:small subunit ribosomal protein S1